MREKVFQQELQVVQKQTLIKECFKTMQLVNSEICYSYKEIVEHEHKYIVFSLCNAFFHLLFSYEQFRMKFPIQFQKMRWP